MKSQAEIAERIGRYVRREMPDAEAAAFEELYFADEEIARLVEAEQLLAGARQLPGAEEIRRPEGRPVRGVLARPVSMAAGFLLLVLAAGFLLFRAPAQYEGAASAARGGVGALVVVTRVRLSPTRAAADAAPAYRFALPGKPDRAVALDLPLPAAVRLAGAATLVLDLDRVRPDGTPDPVWERTAEAAPGAGTLEVLLPGGSLAPGRYRLSVLEHAGGGPGRLIMAFGFEILAE